MNEQGPAKLHRYSARYTPNAKTGRNDYEGMAAFPDGKYVLFADYDQLRQRVGAAEEYAERCTEANRQAELDNDELRAKLALAEQDARRWRFIRGYRSYSVTSAAPEDWDRRIDQRMADEAEMRAAIASQN